MPTFTTQFYLSITREQYTRFYQGQAQRVVVRSDEGRTLQFPASILRPFITHQGIHGRFGIRFDENNKLVDLWQR